MQHHLDWRKFISSSRRSAATARGFRDNKCDHTHPGFDNTFATLNVTQNKAQLLYTLIKTLDAKTHPAVAAFAVSKAQHRATSCYGPTPPRCSHSKAPAAQKPQSGQTPQKQKARRLYSFYLRTAIFAFIVISRGKRPSRDVNAKCTCFCRISNSSHITSLGLLQKDEVASPVLPEPWVVDRDKSWWLHTVALIQSCSPSVATRCALESTCHWLYIPAAPESAPVPYWVMWGKKRNVIASKCSLSRPQATSFPGGWGGEDLDPFPSKKTIQEKHETPHIPNFVNEKIN